MPNDDTAKPSATGPAATGQVGESIGERLVADLTPFPRQAGANRAYHAMVKPIGAVCNLDCTYCYYLHKKDLLGSTSKFQISDEILETHVRQYIEGQDRDEVVFSWQGGEPTLMGLPFFEKVVELEKKYKKPRQKIENDLQTNGTLLNEEWAAFLKQHGFLIGLSIDGPKKLHDAYRVTHEGNPTFDKVFAAAQLLHRHAVPFNTLTVVNRDNAKRPLDVYRFLRNEVKPREMQFIPGVEPKVFREVAPQKWDPATLPVFGASAARPGNANSIVTDWSVDPDDWGYFLCKIWDEWYHRDVGKVFVNLFESAVAQWKGLDAQVCIYHEFCGKGVALEHDGSLYSCDHYVYPEYKLGNIQQTSSSRMVFSEQQKAFGYAKFMALPKRCADCKYLFACNGECPKNRLLRTPEGEVGLNYLCSGLMNFWTHIDEDVKRLCRELAKQNTEQDRA
ncbi:MAG TPA: anaerobic sulfatase maturase [Verrucomicrobiae bacterium]|nr:anaerobic sulfatase maturase [Verrucomicrobiae bacterium]